MTKYGGKYAVKIGAAICSEVPFDGITDSGKNVLFAAGQCLPVSLMDAVNLDNDVVSYCQAPGGRIPDKMNYA